MNQLTWPLTTAVRESANLFFLTGELTASLEE
jgi:hypothetical protein